MSFKQFDNEDVVVSADAISSTVWSTGNYTLSTFHSSSTQEASTSGDYYLSVYQTGSTDTTAAVQFSIAFGDKDGRGGSLFNSNVTGKSPTSTVYGQYRSLILGDEESDFNFSGINSNFGIFAISIDRARYKEKLMPGTFNLTLKSGSVELKLTDDSNLATTVNFTDAGRIFEVISGSNGTSFDGGTGITTTNGSYGKFLPDIGVIILNGQAIRGTFEGGFGGTTLTRFASGSNETSDGINNRAMYSLISGSANAFSINAEETVSSNFVFVRVRNGEFNYSNNPSNISGSGELRHNSMVNNPQAYITSVGLYNDTNDLVAVAKLSKPLLKDFTKEALIRIKLDY
tara:strand:+ start:2590 stop:3621 length:1032 start_codon:yes stop_codon:yes gene_type:complete